MAEILHHRVDTYSVAPEPRWRSNCGLVEPPNSTEDWEATTCKSCRRVLILRGDCLYEVCRWVQACSGCADDGEYQPLPDRGEGCHECGYTGKSRQEFWAPANRAARVEMDLEPPESGGIHSAAL